MIPKKLIVFGLAKTDGSWSHVGLWQSKLYWLARVQQEPFLLKVGRVRCYWGSTTCYCSKHNVTKLVSSTTLQHTEDQPEAEGADPHYHNVL